MVSASAMEAIQISRDQSRAAWEQAVDTSRLGTSGHWTANASDCDAHYARALEILANDEEPDGVRRATGCLEEARNLESAGGDDQFARRALAALRG